MHDRTAGFGAKRPFIRGRGRNSLMFTKNSQILKIFSLIICIGNCRKWLPRSGFLLLNRLHAAKIAKFPVKFPDTRELAWRPVRSALRRQPGSHSARDCGP